jgi:Organic radical activating enzymes
MTNEFKKDNLPVVESFYSLQGEGYNTGGAAFFIRLAGCDIGCTWCDSKNSWSRNGHTLVPIEQIVADTLLHKAEYVIITGGEPLMHPLDELCSLLKKNNLKIFLETSGTHPLSGEFDWICLSPKRNRAPLPDIYNKASELKVIIACTDDFLWAEENRLLVTERCKLYLQPEWSTRNTLLPSIIQYIKDNPHWKLSLQTHKFINIS